jgi:hypothetical protein
VSAGATQTAGQFFHLGPSDLGLFQKDAADPTTSVLPTSLIGTLRRQPGIADAIALQLLVSDVSRAPGAVVFGINASTFLSGRMVFSSGHMFTSPNTDNRRRRVASTPARVRIRVAATVRRLRWCSI